LAKKKARKQWVYRPKSAPKPKVPDSIKAVVKAKCDEFIDTILKPDHIQPPPENPVYNYIVDLSSLWYRNFFYFCSKYRCPAPNCISEFFEARYTRLEYTADGTYTMAYMRHTGKWHEVFHNLSLDECLKTIEQTPIFRP
jgi:hypothetical protein